MSIWTWPGVCTTFWWFWSTFCTITQVQSDRWGDVHGQGEAQCCRNGEGGGSGGIKSVKLVSPIPISGRRCWQSSLRTLMKVGWSVGFSSWFHGDVGDVVTSVICVSRFLQRSPGARQYQTYHSQCSDSETTRGGLVPSLFKKFPCTMWRFLFLWVE